MKISVITVCRNSGDTIRETIESVLSQTHPNVEYIIVDGASSDGTLSVIREFEGSIDKFVSEPDTGIYAAMNKGLSMATGDIVGILNSDDLYADNTVLRQVAATFMDSTVDACYADLEYVRKDDINRVVRYWKSSGYAGGAFTRGWCPPHPTFYARKSLFDRMGVFDLRYRLAADADLMIRFLEKGRVRTKYVPCVWVKMRLGGQTNLSFRNIMRQNREILDSLKRHDVPVSPARFAMSKLGNRILQRWSRRNGT